MTTIRLRPSTERGHRNHGWLDTHYTFSFADYFDPRNMGHGMLRVLNQDVVEPGHGFPTHGHQDMEIVTWVLEGALEHRDSMGHGEVLRPGEVQVMSAGTGVTHSEFNPSRTERLELVQMWVLPQFAGTEPTYRQKPFPLEERTGRLRLVVSPDGEDGALEIGQDARMWVGTLAPGDEVAHAVDPEHTAWLHVARGGVRLDDHRMTGGDGAAIDGAFTLVATEPSELILWETAR